MKNIIREVNPEYMNTSDYFDCDCFNENGGDWNYTLFIVSNAGYGRLYGLNIDEYKNVRERVETVLEGFSDVLEGIYDYDGKRYTYKDIMIENGIEYNSRKCHKLKEWAENANSDDIEDIAIFLTITTGKEWDVTSAHGYCQGDYVEILYCKEYYSNPVECGEIWLGACKEFCVIDLDENGNEIDSVYGYYVADSQVRTDEDYKRVVCEWACVDEEETQLEMIDSVSVIHHCNYKVV